MTQYAYWGADDTEPRANLREWLRHKFSTEEVW